MVFVIETAVFVYMPTTPNWHEGSQNGPGNQVQLKDSQIWLVLASQSYRFESFSYSCI